MIVKRFVKDCAFILVSILLFFAIGQTVMAQTSTDGIDVAVVDPSGAMVPNARLTITGIEMGNVVRRLKTNSVSVTAASLIPPGTYNITAMPPGFRQLVRTDIRLNVGSTLHSALPLQTGQCTQKLTVVGQTPPLQEKSAVLTQTINQTAIRELPLSGRNYLQLGNLIARAAPSNVSPPAGSLSIVLRTGGCRRVEKSSARRETNSRIDSNQEEDPECRLSGHTVLARC